jgi:hypothetical protein
MPDATITSTASTFGTITGTFAADQSTVTGTITGIITGTLSGSVGVPGPAGPAGIGLPAGGTSGQFLQKTSGVDYATDWVTVNLTGLATESWVTAGFYPLTGNPSNFLTASALTPYLTSATAASTYQPISGMTAYLTTSAAASTYYPLTNPSGYITASALSPYLLSSTAASTYQTIAGMSSYLTTSAAASTYATIAQGQPASGTIGQVLTKNSGTNYDSSWQTLIPGDRYLTSSTTSLTINNANKTLTIGTGLSYTPTQSITISYDASNHMHGEVLTYNSGTGALTVDINHHTGSGTYASWVVNVGGVVPATSVTWGSITGTLGDQTDLSTALNAKLASADAATTYAPIASPTFTGTVTIPSGASISGFAPLASPALTGNVTIASNSTGAALFIEQAGTGNILTLHDQATDTNFVAIDQNGKVNTVASVTAHAGFNVPHGTAPTSPVNGDIWTTTTDLQVRLNGTTRTMVNLDGTQTINGTKTFSASTQTLGSGTATGTINVASGATISGATKTVNIGTGGVAGSTTNITVGSTTGTSTTTLQGNTNGVTQTAGNSTTLLATTAFVTTADNLKANIASPSLTGTPLSTTAAADTNTTQIATTAFVVGQAGSATPLADGTAAVGTSLRYARQDHVHGTDTTRAPLASPTFTGTVTIPAGASISGFAPLASPAFTGTPSLPTGTTGVTQTAGNNTTALATTAFVTTAVPAAATHTQALQFSSTSAFTRVIDASSQLIAPSVLKIWPSPSNYNGTATSGAGAAAALNLVGYTLTSPSAGVAGNARAFHASTAAELGNMMYGGSNTSQINFSRRVSMAFRFSQFPSSTSSVTRVLLGKIHGTAVGDLTSRGIGVKYVPNGANFDFQLQVHNGTTLTSVTSSTQYAGGVADLEVVSDGAGNAVLYLNGAQVASTTGAPTGQTSANPTVFAEIESTSGTANQPVALIGRLYINTLNF